MALRKGEKRMTYEEAKQKLMPVGQEHLLQYFEELGEEEKKSLLKQIEDLDLSLLNLIEGGVKEIPKGKLEPLGAVTLEEIAAKREHYEEIGLQAIYDCKVGAVLLAGGQGTRLGLDKPKGMLNVGVTKELYLFEQLIHNLMQVKEKANAWIPLFIMTSEKNNDDTTQFFKEHDYFGYNKDYVFFFVQEMAPSVSYDGKIYMEGKAKLSTSPNGNGGWFSSLAKAGLLDKIDELGVEWLNVFSVDNVLQKMADPVFVGATIEAGCVCGSKVVAKADPNEKVGVLCLEDGKPSIVEYYEMTDEMIHSKDENGRLLYNYGVILNYLFHEPERFDLIAFKQREGDNSYYNVKRVIGLPGETVTIKDGHVFIDGAALSDLPFDENILTEGLALEGVTLEKGEYFVLGDNVNNSEDSRFANMGNILKNEILGKVTYRWLPKQNRGRL